MRRCVDWYVDASAKRVVDLGAMNVNGSYRELFGPCAEYIGVDLEPGPGVDLVLSDIYTLPFEDNSVDLVLSGQMLEHCGQFWRVFSEISRVLKPEGLVIAIAPSSGPVHRKDGPNQAVAEFLRRNAGRYAIETSLCDFYGHNITYAPNAWLRRL